MRFPASVFVLAFMALTWPLSLAAEGFSSNHYKLKLTSVIEGLRFPWAVAWLPDGRMLITERPGRLKLFAADGSNGQLLKGLPRIAAQGQGGLLDIAVDPEFEQNHWVYFSYAEAGAGGASTAVARAELRGNALKRVRILFRQKPKSRGGRHFGSRLAVTADGYLFITERIKDMIIRGGENIYPRDIEEVLYEHPKILEVSVIGKKDPIYGEDVCAVVVVRPGEDLTEREVIDFAAEKLAKFQKPKWVVFANDLPKNPIGKVLKKELRAKYGEQS